MEAPRGRRLLSAMEAPRGRRLLSAVTLVLSLCRLPGAHGANTADDRARTSTLQASISEDEVTPFNASYTMGGLRYMIRGFEPPGTGHPLYVYVPGFQDRVQEAAGTGATFAREMARRGYVAAQMEMAGLAFIENEPNGSASTTELIRMHGGDVQMRCGDASNTSITSIGRALFSYSGPDDTRSNPMVVLCGRARVDCAAGVAIHGLSLGGLLARTAPTFAPTAVSALLVYSAGVIVAGGRTCCAVAPSQNVSCCAPPAADGFVAYGGAVLPCELGESLDPYLPPSKRRLVIGANDRYYGDADCSDLSDHHSPCVYHHHSAYGAIAQSKLSSGYDCGTSFDCLQPDGSGYYVPTADEVGGEPTWVSQGHLFYADCQGCAVNGGTRDCDLLGCPFSASFGESDAPWGMRASMDWLAAAARR